MRSSRHLIRGRVQYITAEFEIKTLCASLCSSSNFATCAVQFDNYSFAILNFSPTKRKRDCMRQNANVYNVFSPLTLLNFLI